LAPQTSGYRVSHGVPHIPQELLLCFTNISKAGLDPTTSATNERYNAGEDEDRRNPIVDYIQNLSETVNMTVRRMVFKYTLIGYDLYCRTVGDILLEHLDEDQVRTAMGHVYKGICDIHQSLR
jgi:hypothetical protein